jgi:hypothetical protein
MVLGVLGVRSSELMDKAGGQHGAGKGGHRVCSWHSWLCAVLLFWACVTPVKGVTKVTLGPFSL